MSDRPLQILVIDEDPIFRLGFCTAVTEHSRGEVAITADIATVADIGTVTTQVMGTVEVIVLALSAGDETEINEQLSRCIGLKQQYPQIPMVVLGDQLAPQSLVAIQAARIEGYCAKREVIAELIATLERVKAGETVWPIFVANGSVSSTRMSPSAMRRRNWLFQQREYGLKLIEAELSSLQATLAEVENLPRWQTWYWTGRHRELRAARWLVNQLLPMEVFVVTTPTVGPKYSPTSSLMDEENTLLTQRNPAEMVETSTGAIATPAAQVWADTLGAIQGGVRNTTDFPYAMDILQPERQQELLYAVLNQVQKMLDELRFLQVSAEQLPEKREAIVRDLWQSATLDFFGKYYTPIASQRQQGLVDLVVVMSPTVESEILDKIPFVPELLAYLLFEQPLVIDNVTYRPQAPEAIARAELLLQHFTVQLANATVQMILNQFYDEEVIKQGLFTPTYLSSRVIARFRNQLVWRDRQQRYFEEPKAIFESEYHLLSVTPRGLKFQIVYAPRQQELRELQGIPWLVTMSWEVRDAIAPLLQAIVTFVGDGLVYVLTRVVGRGLGLIGRGIMQGLGNTLQGNPRSERR